MPDANHDLRSAPAYAPLIDDILSGIASGDLEVGQQLASEVKLKAKYGISVNSIRRGLGLLVEQGVLRRRRGSGTFVAGGSVPVHGARPMVRRDAIALVREIEQWRYHPFFTEQYRGVMAGLVQYGWRTLDLQSGAEPPAPGGRDSSYRHVDAARIEAELRQHPEIAGIICMQCVDSLVEAIAAAGHSVVTTGPSASVPYVCYDWQAEAERLFAIALARGARSIAVISSYPQDELKTMCQRSCRTRGLRPSQVELTCLSCSPTSRGTELTGQAYALALGAFRGQHEIDALLVTSDFEAIGATDAIVSLPREKWSKLDVLALLNKESKLHAHVPMVALISDGHACGTALADLMHEQITCGGRSRDVVLMACSQIEWRRR